MLRPLVAFLTLALAAFLLAPTVASVHNGVEKLNLVREMPWNLWKWDDEPEPPSWDTPDCGAKPLDVVSEVTKWPNRINKNETFTLVGTVKLTQSTQRGVDGLDVELFLNETKEEPGVYLGTVETANGGMFVLSTKIPYDLAATRYHLVAHSLYKRIGCQSYREHWSDPEMEVTADTRIRFDGEQRGVAGRPMNITGVLLDEVGAPVYNGTVEVAIGKERLKARTGADGRFIVSHTPDDEGDMQVLAKYAGNRYYGESTGRTSIPIMPELLEVTGFEDVTRSRPVTISGQLLVGRNATLGPFDLTFEKHAVTACDGCEPSRKVTITPARDGTFTKTLTFDADQPEGEFRYTGSGGGLRTPKTFNGTLYVPTHLAIEGSPDGLWTKSLHGQAKLLDDADRPLAGEVAVLGPAGWMSGQADANGTYVFSASAPCGKQGVQAFYNGTATRKPSHTGAEVPVCPILAYVPAWMLAMPWWGWLLLALVPLAAWIGWREWRNRYATTILGGPALRIAFTEPADEAAGVVAVGEPAVVTAYLEEALPEGHTLRLGRHGDMRAVDVGADLRGDYLYKPERLGEFPIRAEIADKKGRVVSRRTANLRGVRYAQEIEDRYRAFKRAQVGEREARVSPREFEAWLRERVHGIDPAVAGRLVALFEEADYGPREATREELIAYIQAERAIPQEEGQHVAA